MTDVPRPSPSDPSLQLKTPPELNLAVKTSIAFSNERKSDLSEACAELTALISRDGGSVASL